MIPVKWTILAYVLIFTTLLSGGTGEEFEGEFILQKFDAGKEPGKKCDTGLCKKDKCNCCPGYEVKKETDLLGTSYACRKCNCGGSFNCRYISSGKKICLCPPGYIEVNKECRDIEGTCDSKHQNCENTGGICLSNKISGTICKCPVNTTEDGKFGCKVGEKTCNKSQPKCIETGGTCNSTKDKGIICNCWEKIVYVENDGCQVPTVKCGEEMSLCGKTGGKCKFNSKKSIECSCPTGTVYVDKVGCKVTDGTCDEKHKNCENTAGICISNEKSDIICKCPKETVHEENFGCKVEKEICLIKHQNCIETGGTCNSTKDGSVVCECWENIVYDKNDGCQVPTERCSEEMSLCGKTGGKCKFKSNKAIECSCPTGTVYVDNVGCKVTDGTCDEKHKNCENTGGICISNENSDIICKCSPGTEHEENFGCKVDEETCNKKYENCIATGGTCYPTKEGSVVCECWENIVYDENDGCQDKCSKIECQNSGTCIIKEGKAACNCTEKYSGEFCETEIITSSLTTSIKETPTTSSHATPTTVTDATPATATEVIPTTATDATPITTTDTILTTATGATPTFATDTTPTTDTEAIPTTATDAKQTIAIEATGKTEPTTKVASTSSATTSTKTQTISESNSPSPTQKSTTNIPVKTEITTQPGETTTSTAPDEEITTTPVPCDNSTKSCKNGGTCADNGGEKFCSCKEGTSGYFCEIVDECEINASFCGDDTSAMCVFDEESEKAVCICNETSLIFDEYSRQCREIDGCILKLINNECNKQNELCENGECKCKKNYIYSETKAYCEEDQCATCPKGFDCDPDADEPCKCNNGYFDGKECIKYGKCDLGFSKCEQACDTITGECMCAEGFKLSDDKVTCERTAESFWCDLNCYPGSCIERKDKDVCICPIATHEFINNSCIDICTLSKGKPPKGMNCPGQCESDYDHGIRCICNGFYEQAEDGIHCTRKEMCEEEAAKEECSSKAALCREQETGKGYECYCEDGFKKDKDGVCKRECDLKRNECISMNAVCELGEDYKAECRCLPLLTKKDENSFCSEIAKVSYSGELSTLKVTYILDFESIRQEERTTDVIDYVKLKKDLRESVEYVYGDNFKDVKLLDCMIDEDLIECSIELQLEREPDDANALTSPVYCYNLGKGFCLVKNLVLKRERTSKIFEPTDPCVVKETFCDESTECESDVTKGNFKCTCRNGFRQIGSFKPFSEGNLVEKCEDIDECQTKSHKCPASTICSNTYGSYECICKDGFRKKPVNLNPKKHGCEAVCDPNPCQNDGECVQKRNHEFICRCKPMYTGVICNETVSVEDPEVNFKIPIIVGGVLGTLLLLNLIIVVVFYRKLRKIKNGCSINRQNGVSAEMTRPQRLERKENEYVEIDLHSEHSRLRKESPRYGREISDGRIIPRVQISRNRSDDQDHRDRRFERRPKEGKRSQSKMEFRNKAYVDEE